jgi:DinB superfamily
VISRVGLLLTQMDETYRRLHRGLEGLTDDEYFWEPVPGCWTIHRDQSGAWTYDYAIPDPQPAPFTTIGWRLVHIADCKVMYHEWAFGARSLTFPDLATPAAVSGAMARLEQGQRLLRADLAGLDDTTLDAPCLTNWGELWPAWRIFWAMIDHDAHHGAEIRCLRDLYRAGRAAGPRPGG